MSGVTGMGMGPKIHQTTQMMATPNVIAASQENPLVTSKKPAANARMGPSQSEWDVRGEFMGSRQDCRIG
jgi:hypothetical protein